MPALHRQLPSRRDRAGVRKPPRKEPRDGRTSMPPARLWGFEGREAGYRAVGTAIEDDLDGWPVTRERLPLASRCDLASPWRSREVCGAALSIGDLRWRTTIGKNGLRCGGMGDAISIMTCRS